MDNDTTSTDGATQRLVDKTEAPLTAGRLSHMYGSYICPMCSTEAVRISRRGKEDPWRATCGNCGCTWEYVTQHNRGHKTEVLASDGDLVVSLGIIDKTPEDLGGKGRKGKGDGNV